MKQRRRLSSLRRRDCGCFLASQVLCSATGNLHRQQVWCWVTQANVGRPSRKPRPELVRSLRDHCGLCLLPSHSKSRQLRTGAHPKERPCNRLAPLLSVLISSCKECGDLTWERYICISKDLASTHHPSQQPSILNIQGQPRFSQRFPAVRETHTRPQSTAEFTLQPRPRDGCFAQRPT